MVSIPLLIEPYCTFHHAEYIILHVNTIFKPQFAIVRLRLHASMMFICLSAVMCGKCKNNTIFSKIKQFRAKMVSIIIIIIIIIKNKCHSNIIINRLQGCGHSKKLREGERKSRSSKVV